MKTPVPPPYRLGELRERVIASLANADDERSSLRYSVPSLADWMIQSIARGSITSVPSRCQRA